MINKTISHYKILEKLGEGGMGIVYKAEDTKLKRTVALKFLPQHLIANETDKARFMQEAQAAAALNHPNVCTIYDIQEHEGPSFAENAPAGKQQFIVMEYVEGRTLRDEIWGVGAKQSGNAFPLRIDKAIDYATQIAEALQAAHDKGIVHRDIKSENIMVTFIGQIKVMDFGLAKMRGAARLTRASSTLGTVAFMSPEQIDGREVDARSDIFSFGVVLYEMLSGELPFQGLYESSVIYAILNEEPKPIQMICPELPSELLHILNRALEKEAGDRYQSMKDVVIELKRVRRDSSRSPLPIAEQSIPSTLQKKKRRKKKPIQMLIPVFVLAVIVSVVYFVFRPFRTPLPLCLRPDAEMVRLTSESGEEYGNISPDANYVQFTGGSSLVIKDIETGVKQRFTHPEYPYFNEGVWSPDGKTIAVIGMHQNQYRLIIYNIMGKVVDQFKFDIPPVCLSWSRDGTSIAYIVTTHGSDLKSDIGIIDVNSRQIRNYSTDSGLAVFPVWSPDSQTIAFIENHEGFGMIRLLDCQTGSISEPLEGIQTIKTYWNKGGGLPGARMVIFWSIPVVPVSKSSYMRLRLILIRKMGLGTHSV